MGRLPRHLLGDCRRRHVRDLELPDDAYTGGLTVRACGADSQHIENEAEPHERSGLALPSAHGTGPAADASTLAPCMI